MRLVLAILAALLATTVLAPLAAPQSEPTAATPLSFELDLVARWVEDTKFVEPQFRDAVVAGPVTLREINWHPSGEYALIAGGRRGPSIDACGPSQAPSQDDPGRLGGWSLLLRYDNRTGAVTPVINQTGCMLFAVRFHPGGGHALTVGEKDSIWRLDTATMQTRNLWLEFQRDALAQDPTGQPPRFLARGLAYRPDGSFAVVTGSALLAYHDGDGFLPLDTGEMRYFKAIGWHPSSKYAIVEGGDTDEQGRARIGQLWLLSMDAGICGRYRAGRPEACLVKFAVPYGLFEPDRADPADITFHPVVNASYVYGYDDTHGTMLRIRDNGTDFVPEWMQANHRFGKYTDMEFRPGGTRALVTALGSPSLMEFDGIRIRQIANNTGCIERWARTCPELESVGWHPSGAYALAVAIGGAILRIEPTPEPEIEVTSPRPYQTYVDEGGRTSVLVNGRALATEFGARIARVEVRIDEGPWDQANVSARFNPANWRYTWNATGAFPGEHRIAVRATDDRGHASRELVVPVYVQQPPPPLEAPRMLGENVTSVLGNVTLEWAPAAGAQDYVLQRSRTADFFEKESFPTGGETRYEFLFGLPNGTWHFRVQAQGEPRPASPWSQTRTVVVTVGRQTEPGRPQDAADALPTDDVLTEELAANGTLDDGTPPPPDDGHDAPPDPDGPDADVPAAPWVAAVAAAALAAARRRRA